MKKFSLSLLQKKVILKRSKKKPLVIIEHLERNTDCEDINSYLSMIYGYGNMMKSLLVEDFLFWLAL